MEKELSDAINEVESRLEKLQGIESRLNSYGVQMVKADKKPSLDKFPSYSLLVIEDTPENIDAAKKYFGSNQKVGFARTKEEAAKGIEEKITRGEEFKVMLDVHFPSKEGKAPEVNFEDVANKLFSYDVPFIITTDNFHHDGGDSQIATDYVRTRGLPEVIDVPISSSPRKNNPAFWKEADDALKKASAGGDAYNLLCSCQEPKNSECSNRVTALLEDIMNYKHMAYEAEKLKVPYIKLDRQELEAAAQNNDKKTVRKLFQFIEKLYDAHRDNKDYSKIGILSSTISYLCISKLGPKNLEKALDACNKSINQPEKLHEIGKLCDSCDGMHSYSPSALEEQLKGFEADRINRYKNI